MDGEYEGMTSEELVLELDRLNKRLVEKDVLLKEVHHRVKNNLQVIVSLMNLQAMGIKDESARNMYDNMKNRVKSMAMVHESLYRSPDLSTIDFSEYLQRLVAALFKSNRRPGPIIRPVIDIPDLELDIEKAVPCGLMINEAVTNSLKHAFPGDRGGEVTITMKEEGDNISLKISDDGVGIPDEVSPQEMESLGMKLIYMLGDQIGGSVEMERANGITWSIVFPR